MSQTGKPWRGNQVVLADFRVRDISRSYLEWLNDPEVVRFSRQRFHRHGRLSSLKYVIRFPPFPSRFFLIRETSSGLAVGTLTVFVDQRNGVADIGILIGEKSRWGSGLGMDAWRTALSHVAELPTVRKITAGCISENTAMIRIMESSGMHLEANRKDHEVFEQRLVDVRLYALFTD